MINFFRKKKIGRFFFLFLPIIFGWGIVLLAFWPAIMSEDSLEQWSQILRTSFTDYHPAIHTMMEWLVSGFGFTPAGIAVFQILFLGCVAALGFLIYSKFGVHWIWIGLACAIFILWPANLLLSVTLWKDIPYSTAVLAIAVILLEIIRTRGAWLERNWWLLGILAALASLFRHNGIVPGVGTVVLLLFLYARQRKWILLSLGVLLGIFFFVKYPLYSLVGVGGLDDTQRSIYEMADEMHFLAGQVHNNTAFTPEEAALLDSIHPLADRWSFYDCSNTGAIYNNDKNVLDWDVAIQNANAIHWMVFSTAVRNPKASAKHLLCKTDLIWDILPKKYQTLYSVPVQPGNYPDYFYIVSAPYTGVRVPQAPMLPALGFLLAEWKAQLTASPWQALFLRPALLMYLLLLVVIVTALRLRDATYLYVLVPVLLHIVGIILVLPSQQIRYEYPVILIALMTIPLYLCLAWQKRGNAEAPLPPTRIARAAAR